MIEVHNELRLEVPYLESFDKYLIYPKWGRKTKNGLHKKINKVIPTKEGLVILYDKDGKIVYLNVAKDIRQNVLNHKNDKTKEVSFILHPDYEEINLLKEIYLFYYKDKIRHQ